MVYSNVLEAIGHTPMIRLSKIVPKGSADVLVKYEGVNIGGSIKTRTAYNMICDAEEKGIINSNTIIVEPTSGNQGIGLALIGAVRGYHVRIIMPDSVSEERRKLVKAYGAELVLVHDDGDIGKCITVNYMMAKDSVKKRFSGEGDGMSFTEFTYQLVQGFDFLHLYQTMNCKVQLGGADQWGNITTGTELIRRKLGNEAEAFAITCPLITKADGTKFGKTESGNVWLDARYTSPYKFYQFWLNVSDEDAKRYIRIFTLLDRETVEALTAEHEAAPHLRVLQKRLAQEITTMIHSREEYEKAVEASAILFGGSTSEALRKIDEETLLQVFEGVPQFRIARAELGLPFVDLCAEKTQVFPSKGECRKMVQGGGVSLNKEKVADPARTVGEADLIAGKYLLVQRGKKNYYLVIAE